MPHAKIKDQYFSFFDQGGIDRKTGEVKNSEYKFATFPFIGSRFGDGAHTKILFVGLDIGRDETPGRIQGFQERQQRIEMKDPALHNPHIAGTYVTALYFLRLESPEYAEFWNQLNDEKTIQDILRENNLPLNNPLSYVALSNCHKFVTVNRKNRSGNENRKQITEPEVKFFKSEIDALEPDIVIFQGKKFEERKGIIYQY